MEVTILGTGNPIPQVERGGSSIVASIGDDLILVDCGQLATHRMVDQAIDFTDIEHVFFTHHHLDHNAGFHYFAQVSWFLGRRGLTVYGPRGTTDLLDGLEVSYGYNIESWQSIGGYRSSDEGIADIEYHETDADLDVNGDGWRARALPVEHRSMVCFAYRFDELATGRSFVFTGDTHRLPSVAEFARDVDVLFHNCNARGATESPRSLDDVPEQYAKPPFDDYYRTRTEATVEETKLRHTNPREAAEVAREAGADTLVLTHFDHYRDEAAIRDEAEAVFDGTVYVGTDGLTLKRT